MARGAAALLHPGLWEEAHSPTDVLSVVQGLLVTMATALACSMSNQQAKRSENQRPGGGGGGMGACGGGECRFLEEPSGLRTMPSGAPSGLGGREHP